MASVGHTDYNLSKFWNHLDHTLHLIRARQKDSNSSENQGRPRSTDLE